MVGPLQDTDNFPIVCLLGAPLFWNCTAWLVTLPVAVLLGAALLYVSSSAVTGAGAQAFIARR